MTFFNVVNSPIYKTLSKNNQPKLYIENSLTSKKLKGARLRMRNLFYEIVEDCGLNKHTFCTSCRTPVATHTMTRSGKTKSSW